MFTATCTTYTSSTLRVRVCTGACNCPTGEHHWVTVPTPGSAFCVLSPPTPPRDAVAEFREELIEKVPFFLAAEAPAVPPRAPQLPRRPTPQYREYSRRRV